VSGADRPPPLPERRPLVGGLGILAGMGIALFFAGVQTLVIVEDWLSEGVEAALLLAFVGLIVLFAAKRRGAIAGGMAIGMVLVPVLGLLVLLSICASAMSH